MNENHRRQTAPEAEEQKPAVPESRKKVRRAERRLSAFHGFLLQALGFFLVVYVLFTFLVGVAIMPNEDMYPRVDSGDLLLFYRLDTEPKAQDIVVFVKNDTRYVSRVIAVAGDTVDITPEGKLRVNGSTMLETNIFFETYPFEGFTAYPITLGENQCFVLADRRGGAEDSRFFGPVSYEELLGTVITVLRRNNL